MNQERKEILLVEVGKFFIDIAKLVFGGIFVCVFTFADLAFIALSKSKK